jgi:hypothetical protein
MGQYLLLSYRVPAEPSKTRVGVWREIKKLGAIYLQGGVCLIPHDDETEQSFRDLAARIRSMGGEAGLLVTSPVDADEEQRLTGEFNAARDKEYREILEQCTHFLREIEKETKRGNFSFAEIEEIEEDLDKLRRWLEKVSRRDRFGAKMASATAAKVRDCEEALAHFAQRVFDHEA